jgi:tRNA1(Val) A37 N6-methylase TrmN6
MDKEKAKERISQFVKEFSEIPESELNDKKEEDIKWLFIEPLLDALGWQKKDIEKEASVLNGRADYLIRNGNQETLVIEAKKTSVHLSEEEGRQAVSYAYHRKIKFAVLTNFKYIRVYHALSNVRKIDHNLLFWLDFKDFISNFDKLWLLSKESFDKGELEKLIPSKDQKTAVPIDERILDDLLHIREWLSKELKSKRMELKDGYVDEIVQIFIDRLIFMRSAEDRGLEAEDFLLKIMQAVQQGETDKNLWSLLKDQFIRFDKTYNSKLFATGILEQYGFFSDDVLKKVIKTIYYGLESTQEKYMFNEIPGDLFGSIYEQYLGTILSGTEKRIKLEGGTGKRKKMGIYYTPSYIVDYIVKNTVYEYIKDKSIDDILDVKILDPACGSGSFITRAFVEVCNVMRDKLSRGEKSKNWSSFKEPSKVLNFSQKSTILKNCIYGVDLDEKAVELAQLNLLLKCLEGETRDLKNRKLPNLLDNIKCGNSLIDDPKISDHAFNWNASFKDVMNAGGFDVVIGNPPYVKIQTFSDYEKKENDYLVSVFKSSTGNFDLYVLFVEKGFNLIKEGGVLGFILPHKFFQSEFGVGLRTFLQEKKALKSIIDFRDNQIFDGATTYTCLLFLNKANNNTFKYLGIKSTINMPQVLENPSGFSNLFFDSLDSKKWIFSLDNRILDKIKKDSQSNLGEFTSKIFQGIATGADKIFFLQKIEDKNHDLRVYSRGLNKEIILEEELLKPLIKGNMLKRYSPIKSDELILFPYALDINGKVRLIPRGDLKENFPKTYDYLKNFEKELRDREKGRFDNQRWYCYSRNQGMGDISKKKILTPDICSQGESSLDVDGTFLTTTTVYGIIPKNKNNFEILLAILNSKVLEYFIKNTGSILRGGFYRYKTAYLKPFPIKEISDKQREQFIRLVNQMLELQKKYHDDKVQGHEKERLKQQIDNINYETDQEVYKLYGLTPEEIKIVEESLK